MKGNSKDTLKITLTCIPVTVSSMTVSEKNTILSIIQAHQLLNRHHGEDREL